MIGTGPAPPPAAPLPAGFPASPPRWAATPHAAITTEAATTRPVRCVLAMTNLLDERTSTFGCGCLAQRSPRPRGQREHVQRRARRGTVRRGEYHVLRVADRVRHGVPDH